jgi:hypothetical protein
VPINSLQRLHGERPFERSTARSKAAQARIVSH